MSRMCYTPATTGTPLANREEYAMQKYEALSTDEREAIDLLINRLHAHYKTRNFKPEPSLKFKLDLLLVLGTYINQNERDK